MSKVFYPFMVRGCSPSMRKERNMSKVIGTDPTGPGVYGESDGVGVGGYGRGGAGVVGASYSGDGVEGFSGSGTGFFGHSYSGDGVVGYSDSGAGVFGRSPLGFAGDFEGTVRITGALIKS